MPNPNPSPKTRFTTDRPEPLIAKLQVRVPVSLKEKVYEQENWQEFVRQAIAEKLKSA